MHKNEPRSRYLNLCVSLCAVLSTLLAASPALAVSDEDRFFYQKLVNRKGTDEQVLLLGAMTDEVEGNYAALQKFRELQKIYEKHRPDNRSREAWVYGKLAYHEFLDGSKTLSANYWNVALADLATMPEPADLDGGYFYVEGASTLAKALLGLKRTTDSNKTQTLLGHAKIRFGRPATEKLMFTGFINFFNGDLDSSRALCSDAIKAEPGYSGSYYLRAISNFKELKFSTAVKDLDRAIALCPDFSHAYLVKGLCDLFLNQKEKAIADLNKAIELSPKSDIYQMRAAVKLTEDDFDGGLADLAEAMKAPDADWIAFSMHGDCMFQIKNFDEAIKDYTHSIELMEPRVVKNRSRAYYRRGLCYRASNNQDKAMADFKKAVSIDPTRASQVRKLFPPKIEDDKETNDKSALASDKSNGEKSADDKSSSYKIASDTSGANAKMAEELLSQMRASAEEYKEYASAFGPSMPTFREGRDFVLGVHYRKPAETVMQKKLPESKRSWIDSGAEMASGKNSSSIKTEADPTGKSQSASDSGKDQAATASTKDQPATASTKDQPVSADATNDPYLKYIEQRMSASVETPPSSKVSATFQISPDGVPIVQEINATGINQNRLSNLIIRSAPFKSPPKDIKNVFRVEMQADSPLVKVNFAN